MQLKAFVALLLAGFVTGEAPYAAPVWKPNGALLVLPSQQQQLKQAPTPDPKNAANENKTTELARLKQQEGSESGTYHVLLADGRLQKVEYATAPLKKEEKKEKEQNTKEQPQQYYQPQQFSQSQQYNKQQEEPAKVWAINLAQKEEKNGQEQNTYNNQPQQYYQQEQYNQQQQFSQSQQYTQQGGEPAKVWAINLAQSAPQQNFAQQSSQGFNSYQEQQQFAGNAPLQAAVQREQPAGADWPVRYFEIFTRDPIGQLRRQASEYREEEAEAVGATGRQFQQQAAESWAAGTPPQQQRPLVMLMPQPSGYVASIQYTDVEPINPPVYSYNKGSPLVRIVRKSPLF